MKKSKSLSIVLVVLLVLSLLAVGCSSSSGGADSGSAQVEYPTKPIDMTIGFAAGISADVFGRQLASLAEKELGQPIVVNNRPGAGGAVGYQYCAQQKPDGYNIVWNSNSLSTAHHQGNMDIDYTAFRSVARISVEHSVIAVRADAPWNTLEEFLADAKKRPGEISVGNGGIGSFNHLTAVAIENVTGVEFHHVPFNSTGIVPGLLGGQVDATVSMAFSYIPLVESGEVKLLTTTGDNRLECLPDVPTMKEQGYDFSMLMYRGISVPKDTPDYVVEKLESAFKKAIEAPEFQKFAQDNAIEIAWLGAKEFDAFLVEDDKFIADLMTQIGLKK